MPADNSNGLVRIDLAAIILISAVIASSWATISLLSVFTKNHSHCTNDDDKYGRMVQSSSSTSIDKGGYESLIGNTPMVLLPRLSSLFSHGVKIFVKMENLNPGGTGKDRAALNMILDAERRGHLPPPLPNGLQCLSNKTGGQTHDIVVNRNGKMLTNNLSKDGTVHQYTESITVPIEKQIPTDIHNAIITALQHTRTNGVLIEGTSGSTGISLASLSCSRGHGVVVVMPDDQSSQKMDFLKKLGAGVVVVKNCSISNPAHYVNVAKTIWEWLQVERRYDDYYLKNFACRMPHKDFASQPLIRAAFINQFENLANAQSHYMTTGPEIYSQLHGKVDAFVMSAGTGGTIVGVGGYLKERFWQTFHKQSEQSPLHRESRKEPPKIVLVDPPGSSLFNKIKFGVAFASQQAENRLRRHRYDTIAEGIGLDRITANFRLGCEGVIWGNADGSGDNEYFFGRLLNKLVNHDSLSSGCSSLITSSTFQKKQIIDDALSITDQQAVYMAHYLLRCEGLFVGSSTAMNLVGALVVASQMPKNTNIVTIVCDGGQRHTSRFWNRDFIAEQGMIWPEDDFLDKSKIQILQLLGITIPGVNTLPEQ